MRSKTSLLRIETFFHHPMRSFLYYRTNLWSVYAWAFFMLIIYARTIINLWVILISFFDSLFISILCQFWNLNTRSFLLIFSFIFSKLINNEKTSKKFACLGKEKNWIILPRFVLISIFHSFLSGFLPENSIFPFLAVYLWSLFSCLRLFSHLRRFTMIHWAFFFLLL